ncbi:MAG: CHAT domain-containing protein [Elusimicrobia bacterium]|nr:CHAT domain-containing protein [Elusimicrobiota bacterium]
MRMFSEACFLVFFLSYVPVVSEPSKSRNQINYYLEQGKIRFQNGEFQDAINFWESGKEEAIEKNDLHSLVTFDHNISLCHEKFEDYRAALSYSQEALKNIRFLNDRNLEATVLGNLGLYYYHLWDFPNALLHLKESIRLSRELLKIPTEVMVNLGMVYVSIGDYQSALSIYREVERASEDPNILAIVEFNSFAIYGILGDKEAARQSVEKKITYCRQANIKQSEADALCHLGVILIDSGNYDEAVNCFQKAIEIQKGIDVSYRTSQIYLGDAFLAQNKLWEANDAYTDHGQKAPLHEGRYFLVKNDFVRAKEKFLSALEGGGLKKVNSYLLAGYTGIGLSFEGLKDFGGAVDAYEKGYEIFERIRSSLPESQRQTFLAGRSVGFPNIEVYEGLMRASLFVRGSRVSFFYAESSRSRTFTEAIARHHGKDGIHLPLQVEKLDENYSERIQVITRKMQEAFEQGNAAIYSDLELSLKEAKKNQEAWISQLRQNYPKYTAVVYPTPQYPESISIQPDELIIEFEVTEPYTRVFVVKSGEKLRTYDIMSSRVELTELIKIYRGYFENVSDTEQLTKFDPSVGKRLYDLFLKPLMERRDTKGDLLISKGAKIIIIPDEILGILPFESLVMSMPAQVDMPSGKHGPVPMGVKYVGDEYDITYYQSATALTTQRQLRKGMKGIKPLFILADPVFDESDSRARGTVLANKKKDPYQIRTMSAVLKQMGIGVRRDSEKKPGKGNQRDVFFPRLDQTSLLAESLKDKIFRGEPVDSLTSMEAGEKELKNKDLSIYRYLIFATHGILDNTVPYINEPALVLNQLGTDENNDGFLTMREVMNLNINAEVVALTACQTGLGKNVSGEGVMGLGRAFQYAGANSVLVSLWSVGEISTTILVQKFFEFLKEGKTKREALRLARAEVRRVGYEHPFFWAPFILVGD